MTRLERSGEFIRLLETQAFEGQTWSCEALGDAVFGFVVGEDDDFDARRRAASGRRRFAGSR